MRSDSGEALLAPLTNRFYTYSLFYAIVVVINDQDDANILLVVYIFTLNAISVNVSFCLVYKGA